MRLAIILLLATLLPRVESTADASPTVTGPVRVAAPAPRDPEPKDQATCAWIDTDTYESLGTVIDKAWWEKNQSHVGCGGTCAGGMESCTSVEGMGQMTCGDCQTQDTGPPGAACDVPE